MILVIVACVVTGLTLSFPVIRTGRALGLL
jgi:hypothetical protein